MTVIACLSGVELLLVVAEDVVDADSTAAPLLFSAEMCLSILTLAADGIFYWFTGTQQNFYVRATTMLCSQDGRGVGLFSRVVRTMAVLFSMLCGATYLSARKPKRKQKLPSTQPTVRSVKTEEKTCCAVGKVAGCVTDRATVN